MGDAIVVGAHRREDGARVQNFDAIGRRALSGDGGEENGRNS